MFLCGIFVLPFFFPCKTNYTPECLNLFITPEGNEPIHSMEFFMCILKCAK